MSTLTTSTEHCNGGPSQCEQARIKEGIQIGEVKTIFFTDDMIMSKKEILRDEKKATRIDN